MIRYLFSFAGLLCLLISSCKTYDAENLPDTQLHFGSGGGFTGMVTEYILLKNGQLFRRNGRAGTGDWQELEKVGRSKARALFRTWQEHEVFREPVRQPGNLHHFIAMQVDSNEYRQSWGATGYSPDSLLTNFYKRAIELVREAAPDDALH